MVEDTSTQHLTVKIYDDEGLQPSEIIGCARVYLADLQPGKVKDVWLDLVKDLEIQRDKKPRGQVSWCTCEHSFYSPDTRYRLLVHVNHKIGSVVCNSVPLWFYGICY